MALPFITWDGKRQIKEKHMITLKQIIPALGCVGVGDEHIDKAIDELRALLAELDEVEVKGRQNVDTLLGCMMAVEQIIGDEKNG
jgi:hypothetical protein